MGSSRIQARIDLGKRQLALAPLPFPRPELPLIVFGCEFHSGVCKACGLSGTAGETLTCRLAETWAKGKGHFRWVATPSI